MSFALTTDAVKARTKTVTRRLGWKFAKAGDRILAVDKLRTKNAQKLGVIEIVNVRREWLWEIYSYLIDSNVTKPVYEQVNETTREGFPNMSGLQFADMFRQMHKLDDDDVQVTRIEFRYIEETT
jgi:UTP-glucose-1-phosphate uridylyltransferase